MPIVQSQNPHVCLRGTHGLLDVFRGRHPWIFVFLLLPSRGYLTAEAFVEQIARADAEPAQDVVRVRGNNGERAVLTGVIVDYTGDGLLLRPRVGPERTIPVDQVLAVETKRQTPFLEAKAALATGRADEALALLRNAMSEESRPWARREIAAEIVRCLQAAGNDLAACEVFLKLISEDPRTPYMDCIPLAWTPDQQSSAVENAARTWLLDTRPAAQLLGASYLLLGSRGSDAAARMRNLSLGREGDTRIALLAVAQLWRTQIPTAAPEELERWEGMTEKLPLPYRSGPYYVIASAWARHGRADKAATFYLKVGLLCESPRPLVARCLWEAAEALAKTGWEEDAAGVASLRRELEQRFPESRWARQP